MWIKADLNAKKSTADILELLLAAKPGEIIALEGPSSSGKDRMIELLMMDDEKRRIAVLTPIGLEASKLSASQKAAQKAKTDVYVLHDIDRWPDCGKAPSALFPWIEAMQKSGKTIIVTGEQLADRLIALSPECKANLSLYRHKKDDLSQVNMNPHPQIQVGSILQLGNTRFSNAKSQATPLLWKVIFRRGYMAWLLSEQSVGSSEYYPEGAEADWCHSPLRSWLNQQFLEGFTDEEKAAMMITRSSGAELDDTPDEAPSVPGKVILPSSFEVEHLLRSPEDRLLRVSRTQSMGAGDASPALEPVEWWLRTQGGEPGSVLYVNKDGDVDLRGKKGSECCSVRPLILINLNRLPQKTALAACNNASGCQRSSEQHAVQ